MAELEALKNMVLSFRVSELQTLLGFAGRNKSGRKTELQQRAVELLRMKSTPVKMKVQELYKSIQEGHVTGAVPMAQSSSSNPSNNNMSSSHSNSLPHQTAPQAQVQRSAMYPGGYMATNDRQLAQQRSAMYSANLYHSYNSKASPPIMVSNTNYPIHPDVRLKRLPFYDNQAELLKPSSLVPSGNQRNQETSFMFHLTPQQASDIAGSRDVRPASRIEFSIQAQMRFCLLETSCEQEDFFPPGISVKVNSKPCTLPNPIPTNKAGVEPKRPPRPVNITSLLKLSPTVGNHITVSWSAEYNRGYAITVHLVRKLTSSDLLTRLKTRGVRHSDFTRGLVKEKLSEDPDCEIATTVLRVSLVCPLGKMRMGTPCRPTTCNHLQCFDASLYLQMNERKPTWNCPVCDKSGIYDNLVIDGYFQQVLVSGKLPLDCNEIQLYPDGSWEPLTPKKEQTRVLSPAPDKGDVTLTDDLEVVPVSVPSTPPKKKADVIDLTLSDSDDEPEVVKRRAPPTKPDSSNQFAVKHHSEASSGSSAGSSLTAGPSSVSSSGYMSPNIITLDSPSPPATPTPVTVPASKLSPPLFSPMPFLSSHPTFLDLDSDSNSSSAQPGNLMYSRIVRKQ